MAKERVSTEETRPRIIHSDAEKALLDRVDAFAKERQSGRDASHDYNHCCRVRNNALLLLAHHPTMKESARSALICQLAALLHDVFDHKYVDGDEETLLREYLLGECGVDHSIANDVVNIVIHLGFNQNLKGANRRDDNQLPPELPYVQDADRLDAMGSMYVFHVVLP